MNEATLRSAWLGTVDYGLALKLQDAMVQARHAREIGDTLLMMEHPHVYTLGRGANERFLTAPPPGVPIHRVSRGGQVTYHGPGQLIGYPIVHLEGPARDVHAYLRALESAIIQILGDFDMDSGRREKLTGVWVGSRKIASIGVGIRRWITLHGFALNVNCDLHFFDRIIPCSIDGCRMTSMEREGRPDADTAGLSECMARRFAAVFRYGSIERVSTAEIWRLLDRAGASHLEAHSG